MKILGPIIYSEVEIQKLLRVYTSPKWSFNNEPRSTLKAHFSNLYSGKSHLDCYQFCQKCEDLFDTTKANSDIHIFFVALLLKNGISTC